MHEAGPGEPDDQPGGSAPSGDPTGSSPGPAGPQALVRLGTSSFSCADWVGPFYPEGTPPGAFLEHYARHFDAVEVDSTYYGLPRPSVVDGWARRTPSGFLLTAKFPRSIVHGGRGARPDARFVLDPDATYEDRDLFVATMRRLGDRLGPLLLQFPYFNRSAFPSAGPFLERLDRFLADLPRDGLRYAVEVRNKAWVTQRLLDLLARHDVSFVLVDQAWMPHGDELAARFDVVTAAPVYVRLLGDRAAIEALTTTWEKEVIDHGERIERWARLVVSFMQRGIKSLVFVNNHYAGHAPTTVRRLRAAIEAEAQRPRKH